MVRFKSVTPMHHPMIMVSAAGFGDYRKGDNQLRRDCITAADEFLLSLNFTPATEHSR